MQVYPVSIEQNQPCCLSPKPTSYILKKCFHLRLVYYMSKALLTLESLISKDKVPRRPRLQSGFWFIIEFNNVDLLQV